MMFISAVERSEALLFVLVCVILQCSAFVQQQCNVHTVVRRSFLTRIQSSSEDSSVPVANEKRLKVLCLHGYLSSSKYFALQLRRLVDDGADLSDFVFLDAPHRFGMQKQKYEIVAPPPVVADEVADGAANGTAAAAPAKPTATGKFRWWYAAEKMGANVGYEEAVQYEGLRESLLSIAVAEKEQGPFDVVLGHSQGACLVVAMDCLRSRPDFLSTILNVDDLEYEYSEEERLGASLHRLPDAALSIVIGGFVPRDQMFDTLFASIEKDSSMNGLPQKSLHLFSHEDTIVPAEASMQAMYLYDAPRMSIRDGDHDPDDTAVDSVLKALSNLHSRKFRKPLVLEG